MGIKSLMTAKIIFIAENDSLDSVEKLSFLLNQEKFKLEMKTVFKKVYNNLIGYYFYQDQEEAFKIFVLPKTISMNLSDNEKIKQFLDYLKEYYRLKTLYGLNDSLEMEEPMTTRLEISFESPENEARAQNEEQFLFYKYLDILNRIRDFFLRHQSYLKVKKNYTAQTVKHRLNLMRNVREPDKTKIHQDKTEEIVFSPMAAVSFSVLRLFKHSGKMLKQNEENKALLNQLYKEIEELQSLLLKKFNADKGYKITLHKLLSSQCKKHFLKKETHRLLYKNLLMLFGYEHFFEEENEREINQSIKSQALFFRPEKLYEWAVYDYLKQMPPYELKQKLGLEGDFIQIAYQAKDNCFKKYQMIYQEQIIEKQAEPDFVIQTSLGETAVLDAKWKVLKNMSEISDADILKLKRDQEVFKAQKVFLVLPCLKECSAPLCIKYHPSALNIDFEFRILISKF